MSGLIHFVSGKALEITEAEFRVISPKLNSKGIKIQRTEAGHLIPLNSTTMEYIEHVSEESVEDQILREEAKATGLFLAEEQMDVAVAKPTPSTPEEQLTKMMEKSNCKHEPEKMELYIQHTAKGIRYFPLCSFCGKRERYVAESKIVKGEYAGTPNEKWTADDIAHAKPWIED